MKKQRYKVFRAKDVAQLKSFLNRLFNKTPRDHYIIKMVEKEIPFHEFLKILEPFMNKIEWYTKEKSLVFVREDYDPDEIPEGISIAPSELEASDVIDFEEIERELGLDDSSMNT